MRNDVITEQSLISRYFIQRHISWKQRKSFWNALVAATVTQRNYCLHLLVNCCKGNNYAVYVKPLTELGMLRVCQKKKKHFKMTADITPVCSLALVPVLGQMDISDPPTLLINQWHQRCWLFTHQLSLSVFSSLLMSVLVGDMSGIRSSPREPRTQYLPYNTGREGGLITVWKM